MNYKDLLIPIFFAFIVTLGFNYFVGDRLIKKREGAEQVRSGDRYIAPQTQERKPLNKEIDFIDTKAPRSEEKTEIETPIASYRFTDYGAALEYFAFKRKIDGQEQILTSILPTSPLEREGRCFLIAFDEKTPFYFNKIDQQESDNRFVITYQARTDEAEITKKFIILKDSFKIDLEMTIEPHRGQAVTPRIFFPSPYLHELGEKDLVSGLVNKAGSPNSIERLKIGEKLFQLSFVLPALIGSEDKYFVHALVEATDTFAQRGYYKQGETIGILSIVEGPEIAEKTSWMLSFYCGPKEASVMATVDPRLEQTLNFGWLGFLSKLMLSFMRWITLFTHSFGLAIIILTLLIRLLLVPFTARGMESLKKQQEFSKKLQYLQQKYKHDQEALNRERAELIRKHGMPGMTGCLPMFLQLPFFFALFRVLSVSIDLYQVPFLWISDLSAKDPYFILPIIAGVGTFLSSPSSDPKQRLSMLAFGGVIIAVTSGFSAGLALYICVTTFFSVFQAMIQKRMS